MFGKRLKELREKAGYTQQQLAVLVNLSQQTIGHYEVGRAKPDTDTLEIFADIFSTTVDYLLGRTSDPHPSKKSFSDPLLDDLLLKVPDLTDEEKESLAEHMEFALKQIEKERQRRAKNKSK